MRCNIEMKNKKIKEAFSKCKEDITKLKQSSDDWIRFLLQQNDFLNQRVEQLEFRMKEVELVKDMHNYGGE
ncbi:MAG: hypothetical protein QW331_02295 [Candidatus Woesearchaeota archaeon]